MKKMLVCLIALMMLLPLAVSAKGTLKVGMECNYAPFNWTQSEPSDTAVALPGGGYADGYDVQVAKYIAEKLGMELEIVKTEWDGLPPALMSGKIDMIIAGMSPTEERKLAIDFSDPYYESNLTVVVRKDSPFASAKSLKDLAGAKITGQLNTFHYTVIDQIEGVQMQVAMEDFPAMVVAVSSGRIDGYVSEIPGAISAALSNPDLTYLVFNEDEGFAYDPVNTTIAVGVKKGSELTAKVNEVLAELSDEQRQAWMEEVIARQPLN
jgi:putative lysine transport system substrate-binding protein